MLVAIMLVTSACSVWAGDDEGGGMTDVTEPTAVDDAATPTATTAQSNQNVTPTSTVTAQPTTPPSPTAAPTSQPTGTATPNPPEATTGQAESIDALVTALPESARGCEATPLERWEGIPPYQEAQGTVLLGEGEFWTLVWRFEEDSPIRAGQDVKMVWRAQTNSLRLRAVDLASGAVVDPDQGPDAHSESNWERPGNEWGTIFSFPHAGCWQLEALGADWAAVIWILVEA